MITSNYIDKKKIGTVGASLDSVEVRVMSDSEKVVGKKIVGNIEIKGHSVLMAIGISRKKIRNLLLKTVGLKPAIWGI